MATIGGGPTVQVSLPVPTPVPTPRRQAPPQPVPRAAKPTLAPVPGGMAPPGMPEPQARAFVLPWKPAPRQMQRALPRRQLRREGEVAKYATPAGKYGTPEWNPPPHPQADPDVVANRANDPLWSYHRYQVGYSGVPIETTTDRAMGKPNGYLPVLRSQLEPQQPFIPGSFFHHRYGPLAVDHTATLPEGFALLADTQKRHLPSNDDADIILTSRLTNRNNPDHRHPGSYLDGVLSPMRRENRAVYEMMWGQNAHDLQGQPVGRRPWFNTIFTLQELENHAAPHDPYRLLASAVISGNRHALPPLVDLLKRRDNPAGWYRLWPVLARAMEQRVGDLSPEGVLRRVAAIGEHTASISNNPRDHYAISDRAREQGDLTGYAILADHMEENGLPQYAQLMRAELANVMPQFRSQPKGRSRLSRLPRRRLTPDA